MRQNRFREQMKVSGERKKHTRGMDVALSGEEKGYREEGWRLDEKKEAGQLYVSTKE